ncbi:hypothetical protein HIM_06419 [Hirsutella minnesotensis 3608]|uniref:Prokaryotic-type class I peptide chain release factors domain-containing protein n=1 Tax=Hirsutella minnesotensis 3608 TaxID=1043627 RepID=A0A0F7ZU38_9HYPO|nr:hypothetical protein HIM_06419 [Hirsutella minnesotensis 3608]
MHRSLSRSILPLFNLPSRKIESLLQVPSTVIRPFTTTGLVPAKNLPPRPKPPPDSEIEESFLKGSGPGGQKINKTSSAVQLKHIPTGIVVKSQATRSRSQNRNHARRLLAQRLDELLHGHQSRSAVVGQVKKKQADSAAKKSRRKYKRLAEEKAAAIDDKEGQEQEASSNDKGLQELAGNEPTTTSADDANHTNRT